MSSNSNFLIADAAKLRKLLNNRSLLIIVAVVQLASCKKLIEIPPPVYSITTSETFSDSADADAAITGIYSNMINNSGQIFFASGAISIYGGLSSDELVNFQPDPTLLQFYSNSLISTNGILLNYLWPPAYSYIYKANACIEGVNASSTLSAAAKKQYLGEAKFLRAFCYFYLVNLFGDVPYVSNTSYSQNAVIRCSPKAEIYKQILADLQDAHNLLRDDYLISSGERTRANKWAATALLARAYLYTQNYDSAEYEASSIINNQSLFKLDTLNGVFLKNSNESILQLQLNTSVFPFNLTSEGYNLIPNDTTSPPYYYLTSQLLSAFEAGDQRRIAWVDSTDFNSTYYYYPHKYKIGAAQYVSGGGATEYYMLLREGEQYLIRAEARCRKNNLNGAIDDLNAIRERASLNDLPYGLTNDQVMSAIIQERRVELFAEWAHRWLDLKRLGVVNSVMTAVTPAKSGGNPWKSYQQLYPIPYNELLNDPNLTQNPGY